VGKIAATLILLTLVGWLVVIGVVFENIDNFNASMDPLLWIMQLLSLVVFFGGLAALLWNLWTVWRGKRRWPAKVWSIVLVLAAIVVLWVALAFNLIGFSVNY
jgi:uncharacterized membrane protein